MDLTSSRAIKALLAKYHAKPSKRMGQNFLINGSVLNKIVNAAELTKNDTVLEVGPGIGTLTQELAKNARKVIAIEKDRTMVEILKETLKKYPNIEMVNTDILKLSIFNYQLSNYKIVANIPYYVTSPLIRKFLESEKPPSQMILMVQKEIAQRICAKPPRMSLLAVSVQYYAQPKIISYVSKESFWPSPKVDSAIIKIIPKEISKSPTPADFFKVVKAGFSQPRKQLANNLSKKLKKKKEQVNQWLLQNNIHPEQRAETLRVEQWIYLAKSFQEI